jgi:hypothetical protein
MAKPKPVAGDKLAKQIKIAVNLIERSWRNEMIADRHGYTTRADRARASARKQEDQGRARLIAALDQLKGALVYNEESAIAEENAIIEACANAVGMNAADLATAADAARFRRRR